MLSAVLQIGAHVGIGIASPDLVVKGALEFEAGLGAGVFANVAELVTNVTFSDDSEDECEMRVEELYVFAVGAAAGASVRLDETVWGPNPQTKVPVFETKFTEVCASSRLATPTISQTPDITAADVKRQLEPTVVSTEVTYTGVACRSQGIANCPVSLQSTTKYTSTLSLNYCR